jgi:hypothetical protein
MPKAKKSKALSSFERSLTDRVRDRIAEAGHSIDRSKPKGGRRTSKLGNTRLTMSTGGPKADAEAVRERRSLRHVYRELRGTYRRHRRESGQAAVPELKEAVNAFKRGPSLASLVPVAAFLDERGLLEW